jgi:integrase
MEGFLYKKRDRRRKVDRWYAVLTADGRRHYHAAEPNTRDGAKRLLAELQRDRKAGVLGSRDLTLGAFLQSWLETVKLSGTLAPATVKQHESGIRLHIAPALGDRNLSALSVAEVRALLAGKSVLDPQSRRHHRATLRRALADALRDGLVTRNVAALAEPPKLTRRERPVLTAAEARRLIDGTRDDRLWAYWTLAVTVGMRSAELLGLTWDAVEEGRLHVRYTLHRDEAGQPVLMPPKTAKSRRTIPLPAIAVQALDATRKQQLAERMKAGKPGREGLVFTTRDGIPYRGENMAPRLHRITARLGLPRVNPHDLRHSAATILYSLGIPTPTIADMLGHSSTRVTDDLYRHRVAALQDEAVAAMQRAVG